MDQTPTSLPDDKPQPNKILSINPDGTLTRLEPVVPATPDPTATISPVLSKDIPINPTNKTWLRIFLPRKLLTHSEYSSSCKLPLIVYFHGGGFVAGTAGSSTVHDFCTQMATQLDAIVISAEYRLSPEHRLPAAYDDAIDALFCIKSSREDWLRQFADVSNCFLMGTSAGGNIVYHAGKRTCLDNADDLEPLKIKGLVLHHPFFGGSNWTKSELASKNPIGNVSNYDSAWRLALPVGADRDHEYSNPKIECGSDVNVRFEAIRISGLRIFVAGCYGDPLIDRQIEFAKMMEGKGVETVTHFGEGYHGMELREASKAERLFSVLKDFISC